MKCEPVLLEEVGPLVEKLEQGLEYSEKLGRKGIGLAAIQLGIPKNIAIVRLDNNFKVDLVNCKIENQYDPATFEDEGCLSVPGRLENTTRYQEVHITNNLVFPHSFIATGLMAVVVAHEIDHMNNVLFFDKAIPKKNAPKLKPKPNDQCFCGSGKKYKKCCGA